MKEFYNFGEIKISGKSYRQDVISYSNDEIFL